MTTYMYHWDGRYFGFIDHQDLFDAHGTCRGWVDKQGSVWRTNGEYLGEVVQNHHVLRPTNAPRPVPRTPKISPIRRAPPIRPRDRAARVPMWGWEDALD